MESNLNYEIIKLDKSKILITLSGAITEEAEITLQALLQKIKDEKITDIYINFSKVTRVNSLGVRSWVTFMRALGNQRKVSFQECPSEIIMQINMIPSFLCHAKVDSFYTNYICPKCQHNENHLIYTRDVPKGQHPKDLNCPNDNETMKSEELEEEYFTFLDRRG